MLNLVSMFSIFPMISAIVCAFILIYIFIKGEKTYKLFSFELMIGCCFIWSIGQFLEYSTTDLILLSFYTKIIHISIAFIGTLCLFFSFYYTESNFVYKTKKFLPLFFVIPVLNCIIIITNQIHGLYYTIYFDATCIMQRSISLGPFFWLNYCYNILMSFISMGVIIKVAINSTSNIRKQMIFIIMVMLIPFVINVTQTLFSFIVKWDGYTFDFTPTSFSLSMLFALLATFKYNFLDIMPIVQKIIFDHLEHPTVVFNQNDRIIKYNLSFYKNYKDYFNCEIDIKTYPEFCSILKQLTLVEQNKNNINKALSAKGKNTRNEITLKSPKTNKIKTYDMFVKSIYNSSNYYLGKIITFHDITKHKNLAEEVNEKNNQLTFMNKKLMELNKKLNENIKLSEKLAISDERNRIARELHDSIGHTLMIIIMLMKSVKIEYDNDYEGSKAKVAEAIYIAEDGFREIKRLINGFLSEDIQNRNIIYNLENLFNDVRILGVEINFSVICEEYFYNMIDTDKNIKITNTVYKLCKEALTNSIRHGKSNCINVILKYVHESINIYIIDNGSGCKEIKEGLGLKGMKERIKAVNGKIVYGSDGESGFNIHAQIPVGG